MLNPKQQAVADWAKAQLEFFEMSNDIKSYTHYNDIQESIDDLSELVLLTPLDQMQLNEAFIALYEVIKNQ